MGSERDCKLLATSEKDTIPMASDKCHKSIVWIPSRITYIFATNTTFGTYFAYARAQYSWAAANVLLFSFLLLMEYLGSHYRKLPPNKKSIAKDFLKFAFWISLTVVMFGFGICVVAAVVVVVAGANLLALLPLLPLIGFFFILATVGSAYLFHICRFPHHHGNGGTDDHCCNDNKTVQCVV